MLFTIVSLYISTKVLDFILEGYNPKKSVTIISDYYEEIATEIDANLERGITLFNGQGFYMRQDKKILYIVISRDQLLPSPKSSTNMMKKHSLLLMMYKVLWVKALQNK